MITYKQLLPSRLFPHHKEYQASQFDHMWPLVNFCSKIKMIKYLLLVQIGSSLLLMHSVPDSPNLLNPWLHLKQKNIFLEECIGIVLVLPFLIFWSSEQESIDVIKSKMIRIMLQKINVLQYTWTHWYFNWIPFPINALDSFITPYQVVFSVTS